MSIEKSNFVAPAMSASQAKEAMQRLKELKVALLEESDYQQIQTGSGPKKFIKRSGWRKLQFAFGISDERVNQERLVIDGAIVYRVTVRAIHKPSGQQAEGTAQCSSKESGREASKHMEHDLLAIAETRAKNRAISDLIGSGEVSAEEMSAMDANAKAASMFKKDERK